MHLTARAGRIWKVSFKLTIIKYLVVQWNPWRQLIAPLSSYNEIVGGNIGCPQIFTYDLDVISRGAKKGENRYGFQ
jgi:hypothetical protein